MTNTVELGTTKTNKDITLDLTNNVLLAEFSGRGYTLTSDSLIRKMMDNDKDLDVIYFSEKKVNIPGTKQNSLIKDYTDFGVLDFCVILEAIVNDVKERELKNKETNQITTKDNPILLVFDNIDSLMDYEGILEFKGEDVKGFVEKSLITISVLGRPTRYHVIFRSNRKMSSELRKLKFNTKFGSKIDPELSATVSSWLINRGITNYIQDKSDETYKNIYG